MQKKELEIWEIIIETLSAAALIIFIGLQIYYSYLYESSMITILFRLLPVMLLYAGMIVLQIFPERLNGRNSEPLQGMVRIYAVRMVRNIKLLLMLGVLFPSVADVLGISANAAYSLLILGGILGTIAYYFYRIYTYNTKKKGK